MILGTGACNRAGICFHSENAVLLCLLNLPRSLGGAALWLLYIGIIVLSWPLGMVVLMFGNLWLPASAGLLAIYLPLDGSFQIEETLNKQCDPPIQQQFRFYIGPTEKGK